MKKTKPSFLAVADIHLGAKLFNIPELGKDHFDVFERIVAKAVELQVNKLIVVGDLYDNRKPTEDTVSFVTEQLAILKEAKIKVIGISGDHDKETEGKTWIQNINGVEMPSCENGFYGANYQDFFNLPEFINQPLESCDTKKAEWLIFHGQVPELFPYTEDKKHLDFRSVDFKHFPNLKGIILGDIHKPLEGTIHDEIHNKDIYIGYCGSPGVVKTDEIGTKTGLLYFDGEKLSRVPFPLDRTFVRYNLVTDDIPHIVLDTMIKDNPKKPVILLEYNQETEHKLKDYYYLYDKAFIRTGRIKGAKQEIINIRSELNTSDRIDAVLKASAPNEVVYKLSSQLLSTEDPKNILDQFKNTYFE